MSAPASLASVASTLDIGEALSLLGNNDLLPPRLEDKVVGQLRDGFVASLEARLEDGSYRPLPADTVMVPKQRFASRTASLLSFDDRVVYAALVAAAGAGIAKILDDPDRVLWPRERAAGKRWKEFEAAPLAAAPTHVLLADVAGFYESISHARLRSVLIACTGKTPLADAITQWLTAVMGQSRGLPQGYAASDHLATAYLAEADAAVARAGLLLHRHGDDIRIPVQSFEEGLRAAHTVEQALRRCELLPNSSKLVISTVDSYRADLARFDKDSEALREELKRAAAETLLAEGEDQDIYEFLAAAGIDVDGAGGYGDTLGTGLSDLSELAEHFTPTAAEQAWALLDDAVRRRPGAQCREALSNGHFHERVAAAFPVLASHREPQALDHCAVLLTRHADETMTVCGYLVALSAQEPGRVQAICFDVLASDTFMLGWQRAWLWQTLARAQMEQPFPQAVALAGARAGTDKHDWIERLEAAKFLAGSSALDHELALSLWERAPEVYRADLIQATARMAGTEEWARRFLATAAQNPVHKVIRDNHRTGPAVIGPRTAFPDAAEAVEPPTVSAPARPPAASGGLEGAADWPATALEPPNTERSGPEPPQEPSPKE